MTPARAIGPLLIAWDDWLLLWLFCRSDGGTIKSNTVIIVSLILLAAYVVTGMPPFDADSYTRKGAGKTQVEFGGTSRSSDTPFKHY